MSEDKFGQPGTTPETDADAAPVYMVEFKGSRKEFYRSPYASHLQEDTWVVVQVERGEDLGQIITEISNDRLAVDSIKPLPILRIASDEELAVRKENSEREYAAKDECLKLIGKHGLKMKLVDVEWQFDGNKITFYFTAEKRVDFRELVKDLAAVYRTRIELRQIGARDEARRVGGLGICGLEQCCTSFLREFEPITTQLAREQNLSLNPAKISGNCGRLLCCLRYESEFYREVVGQFPAVGSEYKTERGTGSVENISVLNDEMTIRYESGEYEKISLIEIRRAMRKRAWMQE